MRIIECLFSALPVQEEVTELEAPKFVVEIQTLEASIHDKAKFTCKATGKPTPEILWYKNDKEISRTDNRFTIQFEEKGESSLLIVDVLPEHDGTYTAEAKNPAGTARCKAELFVEGTIIICMQYSPKMTICWTFVSWEILFL